MSLEVARHSDSMPQVNHKAGGQALPAAQEPTFHRNRLFGKSDCCNKKINNKKIHQLHSRWHDIVGVTVSGRLSESFICIQSFESCFIMLNKDNAANVCLICPLTPMCNPSLKP